MAVLLTEVNPLGKFKEVSVTEAEALLMDIPLGKGEHLNDLLIAKKLLTLKIGAEKRGIDFDISLKRLKQMLLTKTCYYTGVEFKEGDLRLMRTIDRVDNTKGYFDNNVVAASRFINTRKSNLTMQDINKIVSGMKRFEKKQIAKTKKANKK